MHMYTWTHLHTFFCLMPAEVYGFYTRERREYILRQSAILITMLLLYFINYIQEMNKNLRIIKNILCNLGLQEYITQLEKRNIGNSTSNMTRFLIIVQSPLKQDSLTSLYSLNSNYYWGLLALGINILLKKKMQYSFSSPWLCRCYCNFLAFSYYL